MIVPNVHDQYSRLLPLIWRQNSLRKGLVHQLAYSDEWVAAIVVIVDRFARQELNPLRFFFDECVDSVDMTGNRRVVVETAGEGRVRVPSDDFLRLGHPYAIALINKMPIVWRALFPVMGGVDPEHFLAGRRAPFKGVHATAIGIIYVSHEFFSESNLTIVKRSGDCPLPVTFDRCRINRDSDPIRETAIEQLDAGPDAAADERVEDAEQYPGGAADERIEDAEQHPAFVAELKAALRELKEYAEQLQARVAELETVAAPLVAVLLMPGVKAMLANRFHPEKHPEANPEQRAAYDEAMRVINEAYAVIGELREIGLDQRDAAEPLGLDADNAEYPARWAVGLDGFHPRRLAELRAGQDLAFLRQHGVAP
jgi:hypothetical protein